MSASSLTTSQVSAPARAGVPVASQHLAVLGAICLLCTAVLVPDRPPGAWLWDAGAVVLACALVFSRRRQPHIDDRDLDRILGSGGLASAGWIVAQWDVAFHPAAAVLAAVCLAAGVLFWMVGTRETGWLAPSVLPVLLGTRPALAAPIPGAVGLTVCLLVSIVIAWRWGPAPVGQLDALPPLRLVVPAAAAVAVLVAARGWIA